MSPVPLRHRPAFQASIFAVVLAATWIYDYFSRGNRSASLAGIAFDFVLLFLGFQACLFIYGQFTLPVRTLQDRKRVFGRLMLRARNAHGAAIFVQNGRKVERRGEAGRAGPGLLWIDTASAAITRAGTGPKRFLGPGIHFLRAGDHVDAAFSLHHQVSSMGPAQDEPVFEKLREDATEEQRNRFASIQARRQAVSGLTRDGNEVIPEIRVVFKLDGAPAGPAQPGSHFGFSPDAVARAALGEGVNVDPVSARRSHVAWNQLPGLIAADLWREYLAKFTLDELFTATFDTIPDVPQPQEREAETADVARPRLEQRPDAVAPLLKRLNDSIETWLARRGIPAHDIPEARHASRAPSPSRQVGGREHTALQIIARMVKCRMTQASVAILDDSGRYLKSHAPSEEFKRLRERGLRILDVTLGGYRFDPAVEHQIVQQWKSAWLANASSERDHVEQLEVLAAESGRQRALLEHASVLGKALQSEPAASIPAALKILVQASHNEILTDDRLHGRGTPELTSLVELARWVESPSDE
jgi:hypothetical protein